MTDTTNKPFDKKLRIVSDGTPEGTELTYGGERLKGVLRVDIHPIEPDSMVTADVTFIGVELDIIATHGNTDYWKPEQEENLIPPVVKEDE